ncbi:sigma-70 family RNA polymerase sigma factor [Novosphingopyxis sp.]|uniref:sigma-70 family RNA polymerase sigma factor n=1 Tax=Novosphingopyxis sp. TaxID=2709690 RepID=UPI003B58C3B1
MTAPHDQSDLNAALAAALGRVAAGDREALHSVYENSRARLFGICYRVCNDPSAAEDVLQDVYVKVSLTARYFDAARGSALAWLSTIARNSAIDWQRARARAGRVFDPTDDADARARMLKDDYWDQLDLRREILGCMETLTPDQRKAIEDSFFLGLTYAELAEREDKPLGTVKSWIRRGLKRLRECLEDGDTDGRG